VQLRVDLIRPVDGQVEPAERILVQERDAGPDRKGARPRRGAHRPDAQPRRHALPEQRDQRRD
jgi:hypothetical protein